MFVIRCKTVLCCLGLMTCLSLALSGCSGTSSSAPATALPAIVGFASSPATITAGQSSVLSWTVTGATSVTLSGSTAAAISPVTVSPTTTTTYTLTATNSAGSTTANTTITVNVAPPVISGFSATPSTITAGQTSSLSWTVSGATSVSLSGLSGAAISPVSVTPTTTTTYTLTATNAGGSITATSTVTVNPAPTTFTLTVVNGYGSGTYAAGSVVDVFANPSVSGSAFNMWTGNSTFLNDAIAAHTTFTAPAGTTATVTSNYTLGVPAITGTAVTIAGTNTGTSVNRVTTPSSPATPITSGYQIPVSHPKGIIVEFHGGGGSANSFFKDTDKQIFNTQALAAGYGYIAMESAANGYWDAQTPYPNNVDFQNIKVTLQYLITIGVMSATDKIYGMGESDGGGFEAAVSRSLNFSAGAIFIAGGGNVLYDPSRSIPTANGSNGVLTPTIWVLEQQDGTSGVNQGGQYPSVIGIGPSGIALAHCNAVELQTLANPVPACNTGVTVNPFLVSDSSLNFYMNPPSPAYPARFAYVPGLTQSTAAAINTFMQTQGCMDSKGKILINPYQSSDYGASPANFRCGPSALLQQFGAAPYNLTTDQAKNLNDEFLIAFTEHKFAADLTDKVLAFFNTH